MSKKLVLHAALASMILGCSASVFADDKKKDKNPASFFNRQYVLTPAFVWLGISAYALSYQHSVVNFKQNGEWKGLLKMNQLLNKKDRETYLKNASDVFWTRWIGQSFKDKELKANVKTGKIKQSRLKPAVGFMGWTNTYVYTGDKTGKLLGVFGGAWLFLSNPNLFSRTVGTHLQDKFGFAKKTKTSYQENKEELVQLKLEKARRKAPAPAPAES